MPTLHRLKFLATNCAVAGSPSGSPTTSPVIHLRRRHRRRKTLRMLLDRRRFPDFDGDPPEITDKELRIRHKLKDLFVSSPPPPPPPPREEDKRFQDEERQEQEGLLPAISTSGRGFRFRTGSAFRRGGAAALGPVSSAFRHRLVRRAWRPMLLTIPE